MTKLFGTIVMIVIVSVTVGCATPKMVDPNYMMYLQAQKPLMDLKLTPDGKVAGIVLNQAPQPYIQQPNEWARVVEKLIGAAGVFGAVWAGGQAIADLASTVGKSAGHNVTVPGTGNYVGNVTGGAATFASPPTQYNQSFNPITGETAATNTMLPDYLLAPSHPVPMQ